MTELAGSAAADGNAVVPARLSWQLRSGGRIRRRDADRPAARRRTSAADAIGSCEAHGWRQSGRNVIQADSHPSTLRDENHRGKSDVGPSFTQRVTLLPYPQLVARNGFVFCHEVGPFPHRIAGRWKTCATLTLSERRQLRKGRVNLKVERQPRIHDPLGDSSRRIATGRASARFHTSKNRACSR